MKNSGGLETNQSCNNKLILLLKSIAKANFQHHVRITVDYESSQTSDLFSQDIVVCTYENSWTSIIIF